MIRQFRMLGLVVVLAGLFAGQAWAQEAPSRPFRGLFGGNERKPGTRQNLDAVWEVQGGRDEDVLAATGSVPLFDPRYQLGGDYAVTNLALSYGTGTKGQGVTFGGRVSSDYKYAPPTLGQLSSLQQEAQVALGLSKRKGILSLNAQNGAAFAPYRRMMLFPRLPELDAAPVTPAGYDLAISSDHVYMMSTDAGLGLQLGRRSTFNASYTRALTDYASQSARMLDQSLGGGVTHQLTQHAILRLGYRYREALYSAFREDGPVPSRSFDAGIDYNRPLSISRKTTVSFGSGSTGVSDGRRTSYFATGAAALNYEIGRSWATRLSFNRGLSFIDGFATPFISDGVSSETGGYVGRRVDVGVSGGYADASSAVSSSRSRYNTYTGAARVRVALSRYSSFFVQYFYFQYHLRDFERTLQGVPPSMERRGVRGGLTVWLPLLR